MGETFMRAYRPGDEEAINDGFNEVFGLHRSLEDWRWKFQRAGSDEKIMLAFDETGAIFAHYAAIPVVLKAGEIAVRAGQIVDIYSRPGARRGLAAASAFRDLVRRFVAEYCSPEGLAVTYGFPGPRHLDLVRLGVGRHGEAEIAPHPVKVWVRNAKVRGRLWSHYEVSEGFDASSLDALWAVAGSRYHIGVVRDGAWISRRFVGRPGVRYVHLAVHRRGVIQAWAVVRPGAPVTALAELVWDGEARRALMALERAVGRLARQAGAERVEMWLSGDTLAEEVFGACGWVPGQQPDGLHMVGYTFDPRLDPASFAGNFYLTMSDADLV